MHLHCAAFLPLMLGHGHSLIAGLLPPSGQLPRHVGLHHVKRPGPQPRERVTPFPDAPVIEQHAAKVALGREVLLVSSVVPRGLGLAACRHAPLVLQCVAPADLSQHVRVIGLSGECFRQLPRGEPGKVRPV